MFKEKEKEIYNGVEYPVVKTNKYEEAKASALKLLKEKKFHLAEGDFWLLRKFDKNINCVVYDGLIISHNGVKKINASLEEDNKFDPFYLLKPETRNAENGSGTLNMEQTAVNGIPGYKLTYFATGKQKEYCVAEINNYNLRDMRYPFAMLQKRLFDRVVLDLAEVGFDGIMVEDEADDFAKTSDTPVITSKDDNVSTDKTAVEENVTASKNMLENNEPVKEPVKTEEVNAADQVAGAPVVEHNDLKEMSLEDALKHVIETSIVSFAKGHPMSMCVKNVNSKEAGINLLKVISANGTDNDKSAAKTILDAIEKDDSIFTIRNK